MLKLQNNTWVMAWPRAETALFTDQENTLNVLQWQQKFHAIKQLIQSHEGETVLLHQEDSVHFSLWFIALCQLGKHIVLAPDSQPQTIEMASQYCNYRAPVLTELTSTNTTFEPEFTFNSNTKVSFFTSGSTGTPKLISKKLSQLLLEVQTLHAQFGENLSANTLFAATVSYQHIYGLLFRMLWPLCYGFVQYRKQISYLEEWQDCLKKYPVVFIASPAHLSRFDDLHILCAEAEKCLRIFSSGGPLADDVPARYIETLKQAPTEVFGSTETGGIAFRQRHNKMQAWQVFKGISISQNAEQALEVISPYLDDNLGVFTTSDKIELVGDNSFRLLGRLDRIVKIEEKRVSLPELEKHCKESMLIEDAAATLLTHGKTQLALAVVLTEKGQAILETQGKNALNQLVKQHLLLRFERVMLPRKFRYIKALPYNQQGKLPLKQLIDLFNE